MYEMEFVYYIHQNVSRGTTTAHTTFTGERREGVHKQFIILVKCIHVIFIHHLYLWYLQCLRVELKDILCRDNPKHLYPFMQFLKNEGAINVLQFSLACGRLSIITEHHQIFVLKLLAWIMINIHFFGYMYLHIFCVQLVNSSLF